MIHDHDYLSTFQGGRVATIFDNMLSSCSEFKDFIADYKIAKASDEKLNVIIVKGQYMSLDVVKNDAKFFRYYTGLPSYDVFLALFNYLQPLAVNMQYACNIGKGHNADRFCSKSGRLRVLSLEEEMFATMVRLRLGLPSQDLSRRFGISASTFFVVFNTWVILLSKELEQICCMPSNEQTKQAE